MSANSDVQLWRNCPWWIRSCQEMTTTDGLLPYIGSAISLDIVHPMIWWLYDCKYTLFIQQCDVNIYNAQIIQSMESILIRHQPDDLSDRCLIDINPSVYAVQLYEVNQYTWYCIDNNSLLWRHNGHYCVSNHQPHHCLPNWLVWCRSKKTSKLRVTGLFARNSLVTAQMASNAENVSIWWRHPALSQKQYIGNALYDTRGRFC